MDSALAGFYFLWYCPVYDVCLCALGRIHNGHKVVFCFLHATPFHYHHHADLLTCIEHIRWKIPEAFLHACWLYSVESVFALDVVGSFAYLIYFILFAIYAFVCFKPAHSSFGDREDIFVTHLIIVIRSEVSDIVIICFRGCVPDTFVPSYNVGFIFIREKLVLLLLLCSFMMRANDSVD